jgi:hypothetical protein
LAGENLDFETTEAEFAEAANLLRLGRAGLIRICESLL